MADRQVVVQGGSNNLYKITEYGGEFYAYKADVGIFGAVSLSSIGSARNLSDAIEIIKAHSGRQIEKICDW